LAYLVLLRVEIARFTLMPVVRSRIDQRAAADGAAGAAVLLPPGGARSARVASSRQFVAALALPS
jgi:hypothetical protein